MPVEFSEVTFKRKIFIDKEFFEYRKRITFFTVLFVFFALSGCFYSVFNPGFERSLIIFLYSLFDFSSFRFGLFCFFCISLILSGLTVFGRICSIISFSFISFICGSLSTAVFDLFKQGIVLRPLLLLLFLTFAAVSLTALSVSVFNYSKNAFSGSTALFIYLPLLRYLLFSVSFSVYISVFIYLFLMFTSG